MSVRGFVSGTAEVRDPEGNLKGILTFEGPATLDEVKSVFGQTGDTPKEE